MDRVENPGGNVKGLAPAEETRREGLRALRRYLEELRETGVDALAFAPPSVTERAVSPEAEAEAAFHPGEAAEGRESLDDVRRDLGECRRCALGDGRTNLVFGVGNPDARLVFVGEAPGRDEDLKGEPFVGEAGQLLTRIIEAMGFGRDEVYICNVLKCRPPENRNPLPAEIESCRPYLLRQLRTIAPEVIVALGTFPAQTLLETKEPISRLRGHFHDYHGIPLMPTFHPAFLLRNPSMKKQVWEDVQQVMRKLGKELEGKKK